MQQTTANRIAGADLQTETILGVAGVIHELDVDPVRMGGHPRTS